MTAAERSGHVRRLTRALGRATTPEAARSLRWQRALWAGHVGEVLDLLGDAHPDSVRLGPAGDALIHHAIGVTSPEVLRALIGRGADVDYGAGDGFPALLNAIVHEADPARRLAVVGLLLDAGADVQRRGVNHWTPLHAAALTGDARLVRLLLDAGADPEARTVIDDDATAAEEADRLGVPAGAAAIRAWLAERR